MDSVKKTPYLLALLLMAAPFTHLLLPYSHIPLSFIILSLLLATADKKNPHITFVISLVSIAVQVYVLHSVNAPMNIIHFIALMATMALFLTNDQTLQQSIKSYRKKHMEMDMTQANSQVLRDMIKRTIGRETVSDTASQIIKVFKQYYHFDNCTIFVSDFQNQLEVKGTTVSNDEIMSLETIARERLNELNHTGKASIYKDKEASMKCLQSLKRNVQYSYFHPILENTNLVAALLVENNSDKNLDKTVKGSFFKLIVDNIHLMVKNALNHEHVIRLTMTDSLTGAYTQEYLDHVLNQKLEEYRNTGKSFTIALIDVDHLGKLNTEYGQAFGDLVLKRAGTFYPKKYPPQCQGRYDFPLQKRPFCHLFCRCESREYFRTAEQTARKTG